MKNKEIEEILNDLKNTADTSFFALCGSEEELKKMPRSVCNFLTLNDKKAKLLLSYIEQLENNRDKALKKLNKYRNRKDHYGLWCMEYIDNADIIHILKGDSDNEQR